jgi:hypothetical protein
LSDFAANKGINIKVEVKFAEPGVEVKPSPGREKAHAEFKDGVLHLTFPNDVPPPDLIHESYSALYEASQAEGRAGGQEPKPEERAAERQAVRETVAETFKDSELAKGKLPEPGERLGARLHPPVEAPPQTARLTITGDSVMFGEHNLGKLNDVLKENREKVEEKLKQLEDEKKTGTDEYKFWKELHTDLNRGTPHERLAALDRAYARTGGRLTPEARGKVLPHEKAGGHPGEARSRAVVIFTLIEKGLPLLVAAGFAIGVAEQAAPKPRKRADIVVGPGG